MSKKSVIALSLIVFGLMLIGGVVYAYDSSKKDTIAHGVKVGGVEVGGLSPAEAETKLQEDLLSPLNKNVKIVYHAKEFTLSPAEAKVSANLHGMVGTALAKSREGSILDRTFRALTGDDVSTDIPVSVDYSKKAVLRKVSQIKKAVSRAPVNASLDYSANGFEPVAARDGVAVNTKALRRQIRRALVTTDRGVVRVEASRVKPQVQTADLARDNPNVIIVNRSGFKLRYYKNLKLVKTYSIAVGQAGLETPAGLYSIQDMQVNPSWHVPNSDWAGDLAGKVIPPGPDNPIKARWMGIYAGAGIHGTSDEGSLGTAASHGCVRMAVSDVVDLYDRVATGTPVYIA